MSPLRSGHKNFLDIISNNQFIIDANNHKWVSKRDIFKFCCFVFRTFRPSFVLNLFWTIAQTQRSPNILFQGQRTQTQTKSSRLPEVQLKLFFIRLKFGACEDSVKIRIVSISKISFNGKKTFYWKTTDYFFWLEKQKNLLFLFFSRHLSSKPLNVNPNPLQRKKASNAFECHRRCWSWSWSWSICWSSSCLVITALITLLYANARPSARHCSKTENSNGECESLKNA